MVTRNQFEVIFNPLCNYQLKVTNLKCRNRHNRSSVWIQFVGKLVMLQTCKLLVALDEGGTEPS